MEPSAPVPPDQPQPYSPVPPPPPPSAPFTPPQPPVPPPSPQPYQPPQPPVTPPPPAPAPEPAQPAPSPSAWLADLSTQNVAAPAPGQVVTGSFEPANSGSTSGPPPQPGAQFSSQGPPSQQFPSPKRKFRMSKPLWGVAALLILLIGFGTYTFAYKNNPSLVYSQSLSNTGKGYNKLIDYVDTQSQIGYKGYAGDGSFRVKSSDFSTDGKISFKGDDQNGQLSFDVGLGATRLNVDILTIKSSGTSPDLYFKASGIKGLGSLAGSPDLDAKLASLDNSWIVIDHTLADSISQAVGGTSKPSYPSRDQIIDEAKAFGKVNQQYLFSTNKSKALLTVTNRIGKEKVDGHNTYHYQVAWQKDHLNPYIDAQEAAVKSSKLEAWIKANHYEDSTKAFFKDLRDSTKDVKSSDTFDIWSDIDHRVIYKARFPDSTNGAENYTDVGLDYKGGANYPFFIAGHSKDGGSTADYKVTGNLNSTSGEVSINVTAKDTGSYPAEFSGDFKMHPTNVRVRISKPTGAKSLAEVLSELGLGNYLTELQSMSSGGGGGSFNQGIQDKASNSKRQADLNSIQTQLEAFFSLNGYYPSLKDMNTASWLNQNMKSLDQNALIDPSSASQSKILASAPAAGVYAYQPTNSADQSCESNDKTCVQYTLTATLDGTVNGTHTYVKTNLD